MKVYWILLVSESSIIFTKFTAKEKKERKKEGRMTTEAIKFPDCYPKAPSICIQVAQPFFDCIDKNSVKENPEDRDAGVRGLNLCLKEMQIYVDCMSEYEKNKPAHRFRVLIILFSPAKY